MHFHIRWGIVLAALLALPVIALVVTALEGANQCRESAIRVVSAAAVQDRPADFDAVERFCDEQLSFGQRFVRFFSFTTIAGYLAACLLFSFVMARYWHRRSHR